MPMNFHLARSGGWCIIAFLAVTVMPSLFAASPQTTQPPQAIILSDATLPHFDADLCAALERTMAQAGYQAVTIDVAGLTKPHALETDHCALLILPEARWLPTSIIPAITTYANQGGDLLVLGAPAWGTPLTLTPDGHWQAEGAEARTQALQPPAFPFLDFNSAFPLTALIRETNADQTMTTTELVPTGAGPGRVTGALHVSISDLSGWDMWRTPDLTSSPFAQGRTLTVLSARGDARTHQLALEWDDTDGTRWIAVIPLTEQWQQYTLIPSEFHAWGVTSAVRVKTGFVPADALRFKAGLAFTHTGQLGGAHQYWLAGVGTEAAAPEVTKPIAVPALETIAPNYKFSPIHGIVRLATPQNQVLMTKPEEWSNIDAAALRVMSSPPRPGGAGFDKGRGWRWQPLVVARDASTGQWRGDPATLFIHQPDGSAPYRGSVWASFAVGDPAFYQQGSTLKLLEDVARRMREGIYLLDGGASCNTLLPGQDVTLGATVSNLGAVPQTVKARVTVTAPSGGTPLWQQTWPLVVPGQATVKTPSASWTPPSTDFPVSGDTVTTELWLGGTLIDRLQHKLYEWEPSPSPHYVTVGSDGHFHFLGALWRACGVNYAPSSGIAQENHHLFQHWLEPASYDPDTVERDLYHIQDLGFNAVSMWVYPDEASWQNLLDFLRRCRIHHLKVSLMLAPSVSSPDAANALRPLITRFRLPENDTVFAYEIAWEPEANGHDARTSMDADWQKWITTHYGSIDKAQTAWQTTVPRDAHGNIMNPSDAALSRPDGPDAFMAVAYRRFLDDWTANYYGPVVQALHQIDPHHLVSFRMNHAGDPTDQGGMPYAFEGLSRATDYLAPEGYGRVGDWNQVRPGWFTVAYARAVAPSKPILWAEVGTSVWDKATGGDTTDNLTFQGQFYDNFFRMATLSGSDGLFFWWFPGGYRFDEKSDYGVLNPDGTDRPASIVIRHDAPLFLHAPPPVPNVWLTFNRDNYANGIVGVYNALSAAFWSAVSAGQQPGLRAAAKQ